MNFYSQILLVALESFFVISLISLCEPLFDATFTQSIYLYIPFACKLVALKITIHAALGQ